MTATDELRKLLDGRGVECSQTEWIDGTTIKWHGSDGIEYGARNGVSFDGPTGRLALYGITPEQAVEATLGKGTCRRVLYEPTGVLVCSECGAGIPKQLDKYCYLHYCPYCGRKVVDA